MAFRRCFRYVWVAKRGREEVKEMEKAFKYAMIEILMTQHKLLKRMTIERGCTLKFLLLTAIKEYLERETNRRI